MTGRPRRVMIAFVATLSILGARSALGVIVAGDYTSGSDTAVNITPPTNDPGFYNVGQAGAASCIYMGNGWVLTASHVTLGSTVSFSFPDSANHSQLDTGTYNIVPNSGVQLTNPTGMYANLAADLLMFKIDPTSSPFGPPNLPQPILTDVAPSTGQMVVGIGRGEDRQSTLTYWNNNMPTWQTTTQGQASHTGYITNGPQAMRWGDNTISQTTQDYNLGTVSHPLYVEAFATTFQQNVPPALHNEFQVTSGDSGGAAFTDVGGVWMLSGMLDAIGLLNGQPFPSPQTAVFGDQSILADISLYRSQILALDPLPGDANGDGIVNGQDISLIASNWLQTVPAGKDGDANGDGIVNGQDITYVASHWTQANAAAGGPIPTPEPATAVMTLLAGAMLFLAQWLVRQRGPSLRDCARLQRT
jgi:Dockerin type I domain/Trypsin